MGPDLFIFFMAAVMKSWRSSHSYKLCVVRYKADFQVTGCRPTTKGNLEFGVSDSEYAHDTTFTFETREDCDLLTPLIVNRFALWGLEVHVGSNGTDLNPWSFSVQKITDVIQIQQIMMAQIYLQSVGREIFTSQW